MSDFPTKWELSTFGEVSEYVQRGKGPKYCERSDFPVVNQKAIRWHGIEEQHLKFVAQEQWYAWNEERFIRKGDILWNSTGTGTVGRACHLDEIQAQKAKVVDSHVTIVRLSQDIDSKFGYYWIRSPEIQAKIDSLSSGSTNQVELSRNIVLETTFPVPPLAEQTRIAAKLDELLAQVDTLKARIDGIPALLKRFRQSVLAAAISGRLTEEWRQTQTSAETGADVIRNDQLTKAALIARQPELKKKKSSLESDIDENYLFALPESWAFSTWGKISEWITYGFTRPMPKANSGVKLLTAKDVQHFELALTSCGLTKAEAFEALSDKDKPTKGDLLITKDGSIGRAALVHTEEPFCINQSVAVCWLRSTTMNKRYLELLSNSEFTQRFVQDKAQGMAIQHLSIIDFAKCPVPVPSNKEQNEIVRLVDQLFAFADQLEAKVSAAKTRIDRLTQSILAKAFRGELVPQDPNDEPASVLLERIKAQRAAAPKAKRGKKASA